MTLSAANCFVDACRRKPTHTARYGNAGIAKMGGRTFSHVSMSFPEHGERTPPHDRRVAPQPAPVSLTWAIFDASLSQRTRLTAFFSSLAVNLLLPFVNGMEKFSPKMFLWIGFSNQDQSPSVSVVTVENRDKRFHDN